MNGVDVSNGDERKTERKREKQLTTDGTKVELDERELKLCRYFARKYAKRNPELRDEEDAFQECVIAALEVKLSGREVKTQALRWKINNNFRESDGYYEGSYRSPKLRGRARTKTESTFFRRIKDDDNSIGLGEVAATFDETPKFVLDEEEKARKRYLNSIYEALSYSRHNDVDVVKMRLEEKKMFREIGAEFGYSSQRAQQRFKRAERFLEKIFVDGRIDEKAVEGIVSRSYCNDHIVKSRKKKRKPTFEPPTPVEVDLDWRLAFQAATRFEELQEIDDEAAIWRVF